MKTFRVVAQVPSYYEATIEADTKEEAEEIAKNIPSDEFKFITIGDWEYEEAEEIDG